ncbi:hypothetical protein C4J81_15945 [Deltaproteobacteria bacterium Smac51]|nr:hypothetical protein C4J81_15945 [Deltaproteobacteria bacterium Smac51]
MTIKEYFDAQPQKSKLQYLRFAEYNFWLFQYSSRRYRVEVMQGNEFDEKSGRIKIKHDTENWNRVRKIMVRLLTDAKVENNAFTKWMERGNYIKNEWVRGSPSCDQVKLHIRYLVSAYDAQYSYANNLFYLPLSRMEQTLIEEYASLPVDIQSEAKFLSDLSHTYGDYFYNYADWFPMNKLLNFFKSNHLESLEKERDLLLGKTAAKDKTSIFISSDKSLSLLKRIDRRIQTLKHIDTQNKDDFDGTDSFYERHLSRFVEKGYAWHPLLDKNSVTDCLCFTAPSTKDFLPIFFLPPVLQSRNDNLSEEKEKISQNLIVDRCPFPRGYRTKNEIESLKTKYCYNDLLACIWIKPDRDNWSDGEKLAKKICRIINKEIKNKNIERKEKKVILNEAEICLVAKNISDWDICTKPDLIFIIKINDKNYNKSLTDKSIQYLCKMHFTMYFEKAFHPSDGDAIFYQAHSHASKSFKEMQISRFLGLWAWDQIELKGKPILETVRKAIEIRKTIFKSWEYNAKDSSERHMKAYLEQTRLCVKAGKVLPLA